MKKAYIILALGMALLSSSCSDFLDREPITTPGSTSFLSNAGAVNNYINGLYKPLPAYSTWNMGPMGAEKNSDNIVSEIYDRRLNGELQESIGGVKEWTDGYENLRGVNFFLTYYQVPAAEETADVLSLKGEAYFFRAYWHFYLLRNFGDVPVMDRLWDENATVQGLQIPAADRSAVAEFILGDLKTAIGLLHPRAKYQGLRISKEAALLLAMRVALYEGTWEKYHANTAFAADQNKSEEFLNKVIEFGDELMKMDVGLNTPQSDAAATNGEEAYGRLFNSKDLSTVKEAIFWKKYSIADGLAHNLCSQLGAGYVDVAGPAGISKSLVDNYLNADGTFINPDDARFKDFNLTFENRDGRLLASVMHTGSKFKSTRPAARSYPMNVKEYDEAEKLTIRPPYLVETGPSRNLTGFHIRLGIDTTYVEGQSETAMPVMRYAEALLSYAEAAEELGKCTADVLEKTIKPLRERAGVTYVAPSQIDPHFTQFGYALTPNMQEIRRERRSELALQDFRFDDLMRWRGAALLVGVNPRGAYFGKDAILYKAFNPENKVELEQVVTDTEGWLLPLKNILPRGYQFNETRDYLLPVPPGELSLNHELQQNPGWSRK